MKHEERIGYFTKRAWIRNREAPAGQPAPGHINCLCGQAPESMFHPTQPDIYCPCGIIYRWDGTILQRTNHHA